MRTPLFRLGTVLAALLLATGAAQANNLAVTNVALVDQDRAAGVLFIRFDVAWENSWRLSDGPANHDAAWLFVKYRTRDGTWHHATLGPTGNTAPAGAVLDVVPDSAGAFLYRAVDGTGDVSYAGVRLRWDYRADGVADDEEVDVDVLGIEMVYVPEGAFYLGSGGTEPGAFYTYPGPSAPYLVTTQGEITVGATAGALYYLGTGQVSGEHGSLPASFPKGYAAFYVMKYELTVHQYVDFLNALPYEQQTARTAISPGSPPGTKVMDTSDSRQWIEIRTSGTPEMPAVYATDFNDDGLYDQADDGQDKPCSFLNWHDGLAYADWAGLRPMTELEYEKAGRGPATPVPNEYAWGSTQIKSDAFYDVTASGTSSEVVTNPASAAGNAAYFSTANARLLRVGVFAASFDAPSRAQAGASYYGVMELSGNLLERTVHVNTSQGRAFTGTHGDGRLSGTGAADAPTWPGGIAAGARGGACCDDDTFGGDEHSALMLRLSDRFNGVETMRQSPSHRAFSAGWRGVRTAP